MKRRLATRLIHRSHHKMAISWELSETAQDSPNKFDKRQVAVLSEFAQRQGIEDNDNDNALEFREHLQQVAKRFDRKFVENNKPIIWLLHDPKSEREQYLELIKHFEDFRDDIDQKRSAFNMSIIDKLGGSAGELSRMTQDIISSFSYTERLNHYINDDNHSSEAREAAREHRADTLDKTCQQFMSAFRDVQRLPMLRREKPSEALKTTLETFTKQYGNILPENQQKALQGGLDSCQDQIESANTPSRRYSP